MVAGGGEDNQGADLGHGGAGAVPGHHERLLPGRAGRHGGVRRDPARHLRPRAPLGGGAPRPRRRPLLQLRQELR